MFDYQKYLINKGNEIYQQIRLSVGLPVTFEGQKFLKNNLKCTNLTQLKIFEDLILKPLKQELENNAQVYQQDTHLVFNNWWIEFQAVMNIEKVFNQNFNHILLDANPEIYQKLLVLNSVEFTKGIVNLIVNYKSEFLEIPMLNFIEKLREYNNKDYILQLDWAMFNDEISLVNFFYQDLKKLKTQEFENQLFVYEFINESKYWINYFKLLLFITFKVLINSDLQKTSSNLDLNLVYQVIERF